MNVVFFILILPLCVWTWLANIVMLAFPCGLPLVLVDLCLWMTVRALCVWLFLSPQLSYADFAIFEWLSGVGSSAYTEDVEKFPTLRSFVERMSAIPELQDLLTAEACSLLCPLPPPFVSFPPVMQLCRKTIF